MITQTIVFQFETREQCRAVLDQFQPMMLADNLPRISALSSDDEMKRAELMFQAVERYDDHYDLREAIVALAEATDLQAWSWEKYEAETV